MWSENRLGFTPIEEFVAEWQKLLFRLLKLRPVYISHFYLHNYSLGKIKCVPNQ